MMQKGVHPDRKIIHIDMDAFYASVEQRDFPEYRGKPLAVGGNKERGVVAAASYEARKYGVKSAMASSLAYKKCPDIIFVKPRFDAYKKVSAEIREIFEQYTDLVEPLSLDEAFLDVTTNKKGIPSATLIAKAIKHDIKTKTGLTASAGISTNKFLAKIASDYRKPDGLFVIPPEQTISFIEELRIEKFFGIGKVTAQKLRLLGVLKGRDLKKFTQNQLIQRFGKLGIYLSEISNGVDNRPVNPNRIRKSLSVENTYDKDLITTTEIYKAIEALAPVLLNRIEKGNTKGKTITLKIKYNDFTQITRSKTTIHALINMDEIIALSKELVSPIEQHPKPIRLIGMGISNFETEHSPYGKQLTIDF